MTTIADELAGRLRFRDRTMARGFTVVPKCVVHCAQLSTGARLLYIMLLGYAWQTDRCWPGQDTLARELGVTDRSIRNWLAELAALRILTVERRGLTQSNVYWLETLDHLAEPGSFQSERNVVPPEAERRSDPEPAIRSAMKKTHGKGRKEKELSSPEMIGAETDLAALWSVALDDLREQMVPANYARWLARAELAALADGAATVRVPDAVTAEQLARRFDQLVCRALADAAGHAVAVRYEAPE